MSHAIYLRKTFFLIISVIIFHTLQSTTYRGNALNRIVFVTLFLQNHLHYVQDKKLIIIREIVHAHSSPIGSEYYRNVQKC